MQINEPADILVNALRGIASDGTDHPQVEMHRSIAVRALERYRLAKVVQGFAGARSVKAPEARRCPCGKCGYCDCGGCSTGTGCDYAHIHAAQFPRELPPDAVLVDSAECRVLTTTEPTPRAAGKLPELAAPYGRRPVDPLRGMRVEDLPACGP